MTSLRHTLRRSLATPVYWLKSLDWRVWLGEIENGAQTQERVFGAKMRAIAGSPLAKAFGLHTDMSSSEFRRALPVAGWDRLEPWLTRVWNGDAGAMFANPRSLVMFAMTSGTTGPSKFIPITTEQVEEYRRSWTMWSVGVARTHREILGGKVLNLVSNWRHQVSPGGLPCGSITGKLASILHGLVRGMYVLHPDLALWSDIRARYYLSLRLAWADPDVMMINCANPTTLLQMARWGNEWKEDLLRDIHDGTLSRSAGLPDEVRRVCATAVRQKSPRRVRDLESAMKKSGGDLYPSQIWPHLRLLGVWTGGTTTPFLAQLPAMFGAVALRDHGLSASEGRMTVPIEDGSAAGVLDTTSQFFEFMPLEEIATENPQTLLAHELELGREYGLVITTSGGLLRYDMQDRVRVEGWLGSSPKIRFLNKGRDIASLTGEKLAASQVAEAARRVQGLLQIDLGEFALQPQHGSPPENLPHYRLIASTELGRDPDLLADILREFDRALGELNVEWHEKRKTERLAPLRFSPCSPSFFTSMRDEQTTRRGTAFEQYKHPCLIADPEFRLPGDGP
jgi:hypothetical protein